MAQTHDDFIKRIYARRFQSVWTCTLGQNQSGKTDWNLFQMEQIKALGLGDAFGANIPDLEADFDIEFIEDFQTLKKRCQMLNPNPEKQGLKRYFFLGSEMGDWAPKDQPWVNVKFIKELQQVRKYGLSFLGDAIARVDSRILNEKHFHGYFEKLSKANPTVAIYHDWFNQRRTTIVNIPRTKIGFNTWHSASFYMEPQTEERELFLNPDHQIVQQYLDADCSISKTGLHSNHVKRARDNVLKHYFKYHVHNTPQEIQVADGSDTEIEE